jgi:hypothetical protein
MNESTPIGGGSSPARMSPISRFVNVFFSPGAVFEDVCRSSAGWWLPIVLCTAAVGIFGSLYASRYDLSVVMQEQLKESAAMKLVSGLQGPQARDKAIEMATKQFQQTPRWQIQAGQWVNPFVILTLAVWFFVFLYSLLALAMGWLGGARTSKLWVNLGIVVAAGAVFLGISIGLQISRGIAARSAGASPGDLPPAPAWSGVVTIVAAVAATLVILWSLSRLAQEPVFGRILGVVSYSLAPGVLAALVGIVIVLVRTPDATPMEQIVPSNLTALLNLKEVNAGLASIGTSLGLFTIWSIVLTSVGLGKALGKSAGAASGLVLVPWGAWVLVKAVFAALFA